MSYGPRPGKESLEKEQLCSKNCLGREVGKKFVKSTWRESNKEGSRRKKDARTPTYARLQKTHKKGKVPGSHPQKKVKKKTLSAGGRIELLWRAAS